MSSPVTITVSGPTGSGKSKLIAEICATLKALGVPYTFADDATKHGATADMHEGHVDWIEIYKPTVTLIERNEPRESLHAQGSKSDA